MHDFEIPGLGKVAPYGIYDLAQNSRCVSVGVDHDTAAFAVESIRRWWYSIGRAVYPQAQRLLITADSGGSNVARLRLWKWELRRLADETKLQLSVSHFPPGTSKWNKIEHRLFSFISQNWRGKPLISHKVIINLIAATTTSAGLRVRSELDTNRYPADVRVSEKQMAEINQGPLNRTVGSTDRFDERPVGVILPFLASHVLPKKHREAIVMDLNRSTRRVAPHHIDFSDAQR